MPPATKMNHQNRQSKNKPQDELPEFVIIYFANKYRNYN